MTADTFPSERICTKYVKASEAEPVASVADDSGAETGVKVTELSCCGKEVSRDIYMTAPKSENATTAPAIKAIFRYLSWSQTGRRLVADLQRAGIRPII